MKSFRAIHTLQYFAAKVQGDFSCIWYKERHTIKIADRIHDTIGGFKTWRDITFCACKDWRVPQMHTWCTGSRLAACPICQVHMMAMKQAIDARRSWSNILRSEIRTFNLDRLHISTTFDAVAINAAFELHDGTQFVKVSLGWAVNYTTGARNNFYCNDVVLGYAR